MSELSEFNLEDIDEHATVQGHHLKAWGKYYFRIT